MGIVDLGSVVELSTGELGVIIGIIHIISLNSEMILYFHQTQH